MTRPLLSIGAVSVATGIPVNTLRTWERRYGWPEPDRSEGHQRLYASETVEQLKLVARAIAAGHRPAQIVGASTEALEQLLGEPRPRPQPSPENTDPWMTAVRNLDGERLQHGFHHALASIGLLPFLEERAAPFLGRVGEAWVRGDIQTFHEHFASEQLRDFLASGWRPLAERARGPMVVCATLPGEAHALGLHMAASVLALEGCRIVFVGPDTPLPDLREAALQSRARAVFVSVSASADRIAARDALLDLRQLLPAAVDIVVGGAGAPEGIVGVRTASRLTEIPGIVASF